jgi:hypothetical protein
MAGRAKEMIDAIILQRSGGNPEIAKALRAKLLLKGINPDSYSDGTPDQEAIIAKLKGMTGRLKEMNLAYNQQQEIDNPSRIKLQDIQVWVSKEISRTKVAIHSSETYLRKFENSRPAEPAGMFRFLKRQEFEGILEIWAQEKKRLLDEHKRLDEKLTHLMDFRDQIGELVKLATELGVG